MMNNIEGVKRSYVILFLSFLTSGYFEMEKLRERLLASTRTQADLIEIFSAIDQGLMR